MYSSGSTSDKARTLGTYSSPAPANDRGPSTDGATVFRLRQRCVRAVQPVVSRRVSVELVQCVSALLEAAIIFEAGMLLLPIEGLGQTALCAGMAGLFVLTRAVSRGYARGRFGKAS